MFTTLGSLIPQTVKNRGLKRSVTLAQLVAKATKIISQQLGADLAAQVKVLHLRHGVLTIACLDSTLVTELKFGESDLKKQLREAGAEIIRIKYLIS